MSAFPKHGIFDQYHWLLSRIQWLLDNVMVVLLLFSLCQFYEVPFSKEYLILSGIAFIFSMWVFQAAHLYQPWRGANLLRLIRKVFLSWIVVAAMLTVLGFVTKTSALFSRKVAISWFLLAPAVLSGIRIFAYLGLRWMRAQGRNTRTCVIAGAGDLGRRLAQNVLDTPWLGMQLFGFFDDRLAGREIEFPKSGDNYPVLGNLDDMAEFVRENGIDMVYLALPMRAESRLQEITDALRDTTASVYFVPDIFAFSLLRAGITDLRGVPLISLWETPFYGINGWLKRVEDLVLASVILFAIFPILTFIALGVKLSSPGPIFFKQRRYGLGGEKILVYKFRTMTVNEDDPEIRQATRNDTRVTRFGAFLRRTSLDELPQFLNVIQGTMSIVGPRPHAVAHNDQYRHRIPGYMLRHKVRPGITGLAQVNGFRGETDTLEKMEGRIKFDLDYLCQWSLWLDFKIIFQTVFLVLKDSHAY